MSIKRWYDLADHGAKLDRRVNGQGAGYLELTFKDQDRFDAAVNAETVDAVRAAGWVAEKPGLTLVNYGTVRDLSEVGRALAPIFGDTEVDEALTARDRLRQGETLEGVDRPMYVGKQHIDQSMKYLPDAIRQRATKMIEQAREQQQRLKGAALGPTGGRIWDVSKAVSNATEMGFATALAKVTAIRFDEDAFERFATLAAGSDKDHDQLAAELGAIDVQEVLVRHFRKRAIALGRQGDDAEFSAATSYLLEYRATALAVLDLDRPHAPAEPVSRGFKREVHGYKFEVSADTTTVAAREYQARLERAMRFMGDVFGLEPSDLFPANTRIRVVQGLADHQKAGHQITITRSGVDHAGESYREQDGAIVFSQGTAGTALHEMCHAIDRRLGDGADKYDRILRDSGLMSRYEAMISTGIMNGLDDLTIDPDYVDYLKDEPEVFARLLENALRERCLAETGNLDALGGHAVSGHHENYAPTDAATMELTIRTIRAYGIEQGVMTEELDLAAAEIPAAPQRRMSMGMS